MPTFTEILDEVQRLALDADAPAIAYAVQNDKQPGPMHMAYYHTLIDQATRNLCRIEAEVSTLIQ